MKFRLIESILTEGTRYDKKAAEKLAASGLFDAETSEKMVQGLFKEDIHAFVNSKSWLEKYLLGIVRMLIQHCNGDASKAQVFLTDSINTFNDFLTIVKEIRPKMSEAEQRDLDRNFNEVWSYQDLQKELDDINSKRAEEDKQKLSDMQFENSSNYELIPINSFEEFKSKFGGKATGDGKSDKYAGGGGTAWCHTNSQSTYDSWTDKGKNQFFVLANKNWKNIPFNPSTNARLKGKDDYGNSLIALLVNRRTGALKNATLRCNHVGVLSDADNQYTFYSELSQLAGFNVQEKIEEFLPEFEQVENNQELWEKYFNGTDYSVDRICNLLGISRGELTYAYIPSSVTEIGTSAFYYCKSLKSVTIPDSIISIGSHAFYDCKSLQSVIIPKSVVKIGGFAFYGCQSLQSIIIPNSVKKIDVYAFSNCISLKSITIPKSVTKIGAGAFSYCDALTDIYYQGTKEQWNDMPLYPQNLALRTATIHYNSPVRENMDNKSIKFKFKLVEDLDKIFPSMQGLDKIIKKRRKDKNTITNIGNVEQNIAAFNHGFANGGDTECGETISNI